MTSSSNVRFTFDDAQLRVFDAQLGRVGKVFTKGTSGKILRSALKPTLAAVKRNAPVGKTKVRSTGKFAGRSGKLKRDGTYDKGGATRRDARILIVRGGNELETIGLVGISKSRGKVGWRAHLITRPNLNRRVANDFLGKSERETETLVLSNYEQTAVDVIQNELR